MDSEFKQSDIYIYILSIDLDFKRQSFPFTHTMKVCMGSEGITPLILNLGNGGEWSSTRPGGNYSGKESSLFCVSPRAGLNECGEERISYLHWVSNS